MSKESSKKKPSKGQITNWPTNLKGLFEWSEETKEALDFLPDNLLLKGLKDLSPIKLTRENLRVSLTNLLFKSENDLKAIIADKEQSAVHFRLLAAMIAAAANGETKAINWVYDNAIGDTEKKKSEDFYENEKDRETIIVLKDPSEWKDEEIIEKQKRLMAKNIKAYEDLKKSEDQ